ncbi:hypothetical protein V8C37DRAFT_378956 [Trichoderma ceciliae]
MERVYIDVGSSLGRLRDGLERGRGPWPWLFDGLSLCLVAGISLRGMEGVRIIRGNVLFGVGVNYAICALLSALRVSRARSCWRGCYMYLVAVSIHVSYIRRYPCICSVFSYNLPKVVLVWS